MTVQLTDEVYWLNPATEVRDGKRVHNSSYLLTNSDGGNIIFDTGAYVDTDELTSEVDRLTDGEGVSAIFLTHQDLPHSANLFEFFEEGTEIISTASKPNHQGLVPWGDGMRKTALGKEMQIENRAIQTIAPPILDRPNSAWAYDTESEVFITADGFGHYHKAGQTDLLSNEIEGGITVEDIQGYQQDNLTWMRFMDAEKLTAALRSLLEEHDPKWVAPIHGNPIARENFDRYLDRFEESVDNIYQEYKNPRTGNPSLHSD
jgi:flavorubredoxin